jgi:molecular chaperone GrpE
VRAYVARALARRARTRSGGSELQAEPSGGPSEDAAETDPAATDNEQPTQLKRQVDDDQVNNDTSRAPEPENLTGAQAEVDQKPGAAKTDAATRADAGGQARDQASAPEKGKRAASGSRGADDDTAGSAEAAAETAEATAAEPDAGAKKSGAEEAGDVQPATPADAAGGPAATTPTDNKDEDAGTEPTGSDGAEVQAEATEADAEAAEAEAADAEADGPAEPAAAAAAEEDAEDPAGAEQPAAVVEEEPSEAVLAELVAARAEAEGYLDDLRRLQAEFDNYRKRTMREQTARIASASQALVSRLLPVLDNFELAVSHAEQSRDFDRMLKGVEMVFGELNDVLAGEGLVPIEASGKPFDPERHEAVVAVEEDGVEAGTVVDVIRKGYEFNGRVLRPAMVKVAR